MFSIYVIRNQATGRLYTGYTTDVTHRIGQHNHGVTKSTKNRGPRELIYEERYLTRAEAMKRERFLKSGKGREELKRILKSQSG